MIFEPVMYKKSGDGTTGTYTATVEVHVDVGAIVTATMGSKKISVTATEDGTAKLKLTEAGTWTISGKLGEEEYQPSTITVGKYEVTLKLVTSVKPVLYGQADPLYAAFGLEGMATTVGDYAIFTGGYQVNSSGNYESANGNVSKITAYSSSLNRTTSTDLSYGVYAGASTSVGNYALFAGGMSWNGNTHINRNIVNTYNLSLSKSTATPLSAACGNIASLTLKNYALFAGGYAFNAQLAVFDTINVYNESVVKQNDLLLSSRKTYCCGASIGDYGLVVGGNIANKSNDGFYLIGEYTNEIEVFDSTLNKVDLLETTIAQRFKASKKIGDYIILASNGNDLTVNAIDSTLNRVAIEPLSKKMIGMIATLNDVVLIPVGTSMDNAANFMEAYTSTLTKVYCQERSSHVANISAASVGNYALFAGGVSYQNNTYTNTNVVDVFEDLKE